jgi:hypothetical protein
MFIIGVDIAYKKSIPLWSLNKRGKTESIMEVTPSSDIYSTVSTICSVLKDWKTRRGETTDVLVLGESAVMRGNLPQAYMMARFGAMLEKGVRDMGWTYFSVHPNAWQAAILHPKRGDNRKKLSKEAAQKRTKQDLPTDDLADAANIAYFGHLYRKEILACLRSGEKLRIRNYDKREGSGD